MAFSKLKTSYERERERERENRIGGVMVNMLASSTVDRGFVPQLGPTRDYKTQWCLLFLCLTRSVKEEEIRPVGSKSG
jgi:hypothetical protein